MEEFRYSFKFSVFLVFAVFTAIPAYYYLKGEEWYYLAIYPAVFLIVIVNQLFTKYYLDEEKLIVKSIFRKKEIPLVDVRKFHKIEMNWFGRFFSGRPKTSVQIFYKKHETQEVFPEDSVKFLSLLKQFVASEV